MANLSLAKTKVQEEFDPAVDMLAKLRRPEAAEVIHKLLEANQSLRGKNRPVKKRVKLWLEKHLKASVDQESFNEAFRKVHETFIPYMDTLTGVEKEGYQQFLAQYVIPKEQLDAAETLLALGDPPIDRAVAESMLRSDPMSQPIKSLAEYADFYYDEPIRHFTF